MAGKFSSNCTSTTAPITATILPEVPFPALAAGAVAYSDFDLSKEFKNRNQNLKLKIFNFAYIYLFNILYEFKFCCKRKRKENKPCDFGLSSSLHFSSSSVGPKTESKESKPLGKGVKEYKKI